MEQSIKKFLEFNGKTIYFLAKGGTYWVALKPILQSLEVDEKWHIRAVKSDPIFAPEVCIHALQVGGDQLRKYVCLPEKFIYGWLLTLRSDSKALNQYKRECYNLLYDYFHGMVTSREKLIREKTKEELEIEALETELSTLPQYQRISQLKSKIKLINKNLRELDSLTKAEQLQLFQS